MNPVVFRNVTTAYIGLYLQIIVNNSINIEIHVFCLKTANRWLITHTICR